ncbi:MAG: tol-pal system protein YbgF [Candidatus Palauibacterales bacterium]|nr:tol-pal system protein YbgF [Candidatus Palauibacterales bacterium]MDP2481770.1 tol-pal system protein YbgF [Candidatus Palauibacterales bacterium]
MIRRVLLTAFVTLLGASCAMKSDVADLESTLQAQMQADRAQRDSLMTEIRQLRSVLLDSLSVQQRRDISGRVDLQRQIEDLAIAVTQLTALTGETQRQLAVLQDSGSGMPGAGGEVLADSSGGDSPLAAGAGGEPQALYEAALRQFRRGSYETARAGLVQFLEQYPSHELAPDAQYFVAETYAEAGNAEQALVEYARVLELYPNSRRAPTALYKSGLIELQRGNVDDARTFFQRVVQGYPDSDESDLAERELSRLRN